MAAILEGHNAKIKIPSSHKVGMIPLRFSQFYILLILVTEPILTGHFFVLILKQLTALVKIQSAFIKILSFSFLVLFLVMPSGGHLEMQKLQKKNQNGFKQETFWHKIGPISIKGSLEVYAVFNNGPWGHLRYFICIKLK